MLTSVHKPNAVHPWAKYFCSTKFRLKKSDWFSQRPSLYWFLVSPNTSSDQVCSNIIFVLSTGCLKGQILVIGTVWSSDYTAMLISSVIPVYNIIYAHKLYCIKWVFQSCCWGTVGNTLVFFPPPPEHTELSRISIVALSHVTVSCVHWEQTYCVNDISTAERLTKY